MRRFLVVFASLAIALSAQVVVFVPTAAAHGNQPCYDSSKVDGLLSGNTSPTGWASQTGVFSYIDFHHDNCGDDDSAVSAWVGLVPDAGNGQIIQAGIIQCNEGITIPRDVCNLYPNQLRYFFAYGGCTLANGPYAQDAGPATEGAHSYQVTRAVDGWYMYLPSGTWFIAAGNIAVSCIGSGVQTSAQFGVEKWDRGDSSGGSTTRTHFTSMEHRTSGLSWAYMGWNGGNFLNCQRVMSTAPHYSACDVGGNDMYAWD